MNGDGDAAHHNNLLRLFLWQVEPIKEGSKFENTKMHRSIGLDKKPSIGKQSSKSRALRGHMYVLFLLPSRNLSFGVKTSSFLRSLEDNARFP